MSANQLVSPTKKLTARQALVLEFISEHIQGFGYPPTIREIGDHLGISSTNGVNDHLKALEKKGYLERGDAKSRAMKPLFDVDGNALSVQGGEVIPMVSEHREDVHTIPVVGRIAAGDPIAAVEQSDQFVSLGESLLGRAQGVFGLQVRGDSMIEDGIFDGDYIFVWPKKEAREGEIVAVMIEGEATVKRLYREGQRIRLQPANAAMEPIYVHAHEARETQILGKVVGVFRSL